MKVDLVVDAFPVLFHLLGMVLPIPGDALVACRAVAPEMYFISLKMFLAPVSVGFFISVLNYCSNVA